MRCAAGTEAFLLISIPPKCNIAASAVTSAAAAGDARLLLPAATVVGVSSSSSRTLRRRGQRVIIVLRFLSFVRRRRRRQFSTSFLAPPLRWLARGGRRSKKRQCIKNVKCNVAHSDLRSRTTLLPPIHLRFLKRCCLNDEIYRSSRPLTIEQPTLSEYEFILLLSFIGLRLAICVLHDTHMQL
jgi:hypothetical protein